MKHLFAALMGIAMTSVGLYMVLPTSPKSKVMAAVKVVNGVVMAICLVLLRYCRHNRFGRWIVFW